MFNAGLWLFKAFHWALCFHNMVVVNIVANHGRLRNSLGHGEYFHVWFPSTLP